MIHKRLQPITRFACVSNCAVCERALPRGLVDSCCDSSSTKYKLSVERARSPPPARQLVGLQLAINLQMTLKYLKYDCKASSSCCCCIILPWSYGRVQFRSMFSLILITMHIFSTAHSYQCSQAAALGWWKKTLSCSDVPFHFGSSCYGQPQAQIQHACPGAMEV